MIIKQEKSGLKHLKNNKMELKICDLETCKLLKEVGFKPENPSTERVPMYVEDELTTAQEEDWDRGDFYLAVTQELARKWFRDIHNIDIFIESFDDGKCWDGNVFLWGVGTSGSVHNSTSYEEGIEVLLNIAGKELKEFKEQ